MNYPIFLKEVDKLVLQCDVEALRAIIHELARTLPEENRSRFLNTLQRFASSEERGIASEHNIRSGNSEFSENVEKMITSLEEIRNGDRCLDSELNEEWDDWNDSEEDEFKFSDSENILDDISSAFELIHQCVDREEYRIGGKLALALASLDVSVEGDYSDYVDSILSIGELIDYDLLDTDFKKAAAEAAYFTLIGMPEDEKTLSLFRVLSSFSSAHLSLGNILLIGNREVNVSAFLPAWIEELGTKSGAYELELLFEAQDMIPREIALSNARFFAAKHPELLEHYLQAGRNSSQEENLLQIGLDALNLVPANGKSRSSIALLTAELALGANEIGTAEECWLEAFRSSPTVVNFLRLYLETENRQDFLAEARKCYEEYYKNQRSYDQKPYATILFFDGQFRTVLEKFMKATAGIGWSATYMKEGLALFLLLLNRCEINTPGLIIMLQKAEAACDFPLKSINPG